LHFFLCHTLKKSFVSAFRLHVLKLRYFKLRSVILLRFHHNFKSILLPFNFHYEYFPKTFVLLHSNSFCLNLSFSYGIPNNAKSWVREFKPCVQTLVLWNSKANFFKQTTLEVGRNEQQSLLHIRWQILDNTKEFWSRLWNIFTLL
jgi:hypothetical protein